MSYESQTMLLDALLRIEEARQALTDRAVLPQVLTRIAEEIRGLLGASGVLIAVQADAFEPPLSLTIADGVLTDSSSLVTTTHDLSWGGIHLAMVRFVGLAQMGDVAQLLPLLLRIVAETITVKTHVSNILDKLQLQSRYQAALYYHAQHPPTE